MLMKYVRYFRFVQLMQQGAKKKNGSSTGVANEARTKSISAARATNHKEKSQPSLPKIPARSSSVATSKSATGKRTAASSVSNDTKYSSAAARRKEKTNGIRKSHSDTLVAKLSTLSLSGPKSAQPRNNGRRSISTFTVSQAEEIVELIQSKKCQNIIVMAGAGISTPSGIPDFRTPGTGLYDNLAGYNLPDPSAIFDIHYFNYNPKPFFRLAKELYPGNFLPNFVHYFIRMLHEKKLLLKMFTQNIDALERAAGIPQSKLVEAHGSFATATCRKCKTSYKGNDIKDEVMREEVPKCRKDGCMGIIKPDIVFFGEDLPWKFFQYPKYFAKCDLLIVLGTSLEVYPFAGIVDDVSKATPRVLINRDPVGPFVKRSKRPNDVVIKGDIVEGVKNLAKLLDWRESIKTLMRQDKFLGKHNPEVTDKRVLAGNESTEMNGETVPRKTDPEIAEKTSLLEKRVPKITEGTSDLETGASLVADKKLSSERHEPEETPKSNFPGNETTELGVMNSNNVTNNKLEASNNATGPSSEDSALFESGNSLEHNKSNSQ